MLCSIRISALTLLAAMCLIALGTGWLGGIALAHPEDKTGGHVTQRGPQSVADLAERLMPAVVNISTRSVVDAKSGIPLPQVPEGPPFEQFFEEFFEQNKQSGKRKKAVQSLGSGFVISADGIIVTNNHVISDADEISITFSDGEKAIGRIIGRDVKTDLALLKVDVDKPLTTVAFGSADAVRVGDWVMAIGNPFGLGGSVSVGIVSARNRDIKSGPYDSFIQTDAAINRGNSGGPLFDMYGRVVGVNTAIISPTGGSIGLGFAIPSTIADRIVLQLKKYGQTRRGWLGIRVQHVTAELAEDMGLDEVQGALVAWVNEEGPAHASGVQIGDVIVRYDGNVVGKVRDLTRMVAETEIGRDVPITLIRDGKEKKITITIGHLEAREVSELSKLRKPSMLPAILGMELAELTHRERKKHALNDQVDGVVVEAVAQDSVAALKGIQPGMVIVEMNQKIVTKPADVVNRVGEFRSKGETSILFLLARPDGGELVFVPLKIAE